MKKIFLAAMVIFALAMPALVSVRAKTVCPRGKTGLNCATDILGKVAGTGTGLKSDLASTVATVIKAVLALVGTIFLVLTIYAGILWMTAQGNEEQVTKAVGIIKASVIGLVIIMSAYAITYFVTSKLGSATQNTSAPPPPLGSTADCVSRTLATCESDDLCIWESGTCI